MIVIFANQISIGFTCQSYSRYTVFVHQYLVCMNSVSIVDLALFCLDLPLPKRATRQGRHKKVPTPKASHWGKKSRQKDARLTGQASSRPDSYRGTPAFLSGRHT